MVFVLKCQYNHLGMQMYAWNIKKFSHNFIKSNLESKNMYS